jgi:hypothetical protein
MENTLKPNQENQKIIMISIDNFMKKYVYVFFFICFSCYNKGNKNETKSCIPELMVIGINEEYISGDTLKFKVYLTDTLLYFINHNNDLYEKPIMKEIVPIVKVNNELIKTIQNRVAYVEIPASELFIENGVKYGKVEIDFTVPHPIAGDITFSLVDHYYIK